MADTLKKESMDWKSYYRKKKALLSMLKLTQPSDCLLCTREISTSDFTALIKRALTRKHCTRQKSGFTQFLKEVIKKKKHSAGFIWYLENIHYENAEREYIGSVITNPKEELRKLIKNGPRQEVNETKQIPKVCISEYKYEHLIFYLKKRGLAIKSLRPKRNEEQLKTRIPNKVCLFDLILPSLRSQDKHEKVLR